MERGENVKTSILGDIKLNKHIGESRQKNKTTVSLYPLLLLFSWITNLIWVGNFSLHHRVQTGSGAHPASYPISTRCPFRGGKVVGAWSWSLTYI